MYEHVVIFLGLIVPPRFSGDSLERLVNLPGGAPNHADTPPRLLPRSQVMTVACNLRVVTRGWAGLSPVQWRSLGRRRRASGRPRSHTVSWMALCDALAPSPPWNDGFCFFWFSYFVKITSFLFSPVAGGRDGPFHAQLRYLNAHFSSPPPSLPPSVGEDRVERFCV